jgi:hypothetical protein
MNKYAKILLLALACFFLFVGVKSSIETKPYAELTDLQPFSGVIHKLHCPYKGAAALSFKDSELTFNLTVNFRADYCSDNTSQPLLGKKVELIARQANGNFYQVYEAKIADKVILTPQDVEAEQGSSTMGMFFLTFLTVAFVVYKSRKKKVS